MDAYERVWCTVCEGRGVVGLPEQLALDNKRCRHYWCYSIPSSTAAGPRKV